MGALRAHSAPTCSPSPRTVSRPTKRRGDGGTRPENDRGKDLEVCMRSQPERRHDEPSNSYRQQETEAWECAPAPPLQRLKSTKCLKMRE